MFNRQIPMWVLCRSRVAPIVSTGIEETTTPDDDGLVVYYDINGRRVDKPTRGLYIRISGGKAEKVVL